MILLIIISSSNVEQKNVELIDYLLKNNIKVHIIEYGIDQKKNKYNSVFIKSSQYPIKFINSYIETLNDSNIFFINCNLVMKIDLINYLNNYLNNYKGCDLLIPFTFKNIQNFINNRRYILDFINVPIPIIINRNTFIKYNKFYEGLTSINHIIFNYIEKIERFHLKSCYLNNILTLYKFCNRFDEIDYKKYLNIKNSCFDEFKNKTKTLNYLTMADFGSWGLANQMFQFATLYSVAKDLNLNLVFFYNDNIKINKFHKINLNYDSKYLKFYNYKEKTFSFYELFNELNNDSFKNKNINLNGFYQCDKYFLKYKNDILDLYTLNAEEDKYVNKIMSKVNINKLPTVSIHIRRGDYSKYPGYHIIIDISYYKMCISKFDKHFFFIFSDDPEWCKKHIAPLVEFYYISNEKDFIDLIMMSKCDHNIIANSTFSWWGSYLNRNPYKKVYAPKPWFGSKGIKKHSLYLENHEVISYKTL